ncbi:MAG: hypothetical protein JRE43_03165 [Deltaproteobacteria bacterium]|nr:hypothetical protein [Deltaproteobacteria bacterium]
MRSIVRARGFADRDAPRDPGRCVDPRIATRKSRVRPVMRERELHMPDAASQDQLRDPVDLLDPQL